MIPTNAPPSDRLIVDHLPEPDTEPDTVPELTTLLRDIYDTAYQTGFRDGLAAGEDTPTLPAETAETRESSLPYPHRNRRAREATLLIDHITAGKDEVFSIQTDQLINIAHRLNLFEDLHDAPFHDWSIAFKAHLHRKKFRSGRYTWKPILKVTGSWWIERA